MVMTKLIQVIDSPTQAIFYALQGFNVPWKNDEINVQLDLDYIFNRSGEKITSSLVDFFVNTETHKIDTISMQTLANVIFTKYGKKWNELYETMEYDYNPIENYNMVEEMTDDETVIEFGHTNTRTDNLQNTDNTENVAEYEKAGFNSEEYVHDEKTTTNNDTTQTHTGTQTNAESGSNTETRNYTLTRSGNIGVTTSQQMIESQRKLWLWDFIDSVVYPDVDKILTIPIFKGECSNENDASV